MNLKLSKCARCNKLFNKIVSDVCNQCQPEEDHDFGKVRDVLARTKGLNAQQVADEAEVDVDCVVRLLREGRIDNVTHDEEASCGRCGAPAISSTKRLCKRCLVDLDRECAHAMHEMRARILAKEGTDMNDVLAAVEARRASRRQRRKEMEPPAPSRPHAAPGHRMILPQQLRIKAGKKP